MSTSILCLAGLGFLTHLRSALFQPWNLRLGRFKVAHLGRCPPEPSRAGHVLYKHSGTHKLPN